MQTGKAQRIPIILLFEPFWRGLLEWFRRTLVPQGVITPEDLELVRVCEQPQRVVDAIFAHCKARGFEPSAAEREIMLDL